MEWEYVTVGRAEEGDAAEGFGIGRDSPVLRLVVRVEVEGDVVVVDEGVLGVDDVPSRADPTARASS